MELNDAIGQITAIRTQLAATERLRGLRALPVAFSGLVALLATLAQALWIREPLLEPGRWLGLWLGAATVSALAVGLELWRRMQASRSRLVIANALVALQQFVPSLLAGAVATLVIAAQLPGHAFLLPGLWQLFFALGLCATHRQLPPATLGVGAFYLLTGGAVLSLGEAATAPWAMGLPFAVGQGALAAVLWWHQERSDALEAA